MVEKQKLKCPECDTVFEFDPNSNQRVITNLKESMIPKLKERRQVTAYLECPKGYTYPYEVIKEY